MANRNKRAGHLEFARQVVVDGTQRDSGDPRVVAQDLSNRMIPDDGDFAGFKRDALTITFTTNKHVWLCLIGEEIVGRG